MYRNFRYFCSGETTTSASPIANNTEENYRLAYGFTKDKERNFGFECQISGENTCTCSF